MCVCVCVRVHVCVRVRVCVYVCVCYSIEEFEVDNTFPLQCCDLFTMIPYPESAIICKLFAFQSYNCMNKSQWTSLKFVFLYCMHAVAASYEKFHLSSARYYYKIDV